MVSSSSKNGISANLPRWRDGWKDKKTGKMMQGFWYLWHEGKQANLSKWGAPRENHTKQNYALALDARAKFLEALGQEQVKATQERIDRENHVVTAYEVLRHYVKHHLPKCGKAHQYQAQRLGEEFCAGTPGTLWHEGSRKLPKFVEQDGKRWAILPYEGWGNLPAASLTPRILEQWATCHPNWGASGKKSATNIIKAACQFATVEETEEGEKLLSSNPLAGYKTAKAPAREAEITSEQDKALRSKMPEALGTLYSALWDLGCRPGELAAIRAHHFNTQTEELVLQPAEWKNGKKTGKARYIALTPKWVAWVKARIEALDGRDGFLFTTTHGCQWVCTSWVSSFDRVRKNAKLPENITLYNVRHTWITRALLKGIPIADVANQAGTSAAVIEKHYSKVHLHRESRKAAVMALA
jgi:integrase